MTPECYGELKQGKRDRGALKKPFKNQLKHQLSLTENDHSGWEKLAEDRDEWRALIKRATWHFEAIRKQVADDKRQKRKHVASLYPHHHQTRPSSARAAPGSADRIAAQSLTSV